MAEGLNYNWLYIEGDLPDWLNTSYETVGFTREGIAWAVHQRYQLADTNGVMVSLFPIEDLELFQATAGQLITQQSAATEEITLPPWRTKSAGPKWQRFPPKKTSTGRNSCCSSPSCAMGWRRCRTARPERRTGVMFKLIQKYYKLGLYTKENVAKFVARGTLNETQYEEITGEKFGK